MEVLRLLLLADAALGLLVAELEGLAAQLGELHPEGGRQGRAELGLQHPVFDGLEGQDFPLAVHHETQGDALHAAGGKAAAHLVPEHLADLVAHEPIQHAAGPLGIHEIGVDLRGIRHGGGDALGGDFVEAHPLHHHALGGFDGLQQVPADGLSFAVRVGRENQLVGLLGGGPQLLHHLLFGGGDFVDLLEAVGDVDDLDLLPALLHHFLGGEVADVAHAGLHFVALAQVLLDGLGFRGAFDNHQLRHGSLHRVSIIPWPSRPHPAIPL